MFNVHQTELNNLFYFVSVYIEEDRIIYYNDNNTHVLSNI